MSFFYRGGFWNPMEELGLRKCQDLTFCIPVFNTLAKYCEQVV